MSNSVAIFDFEKPIDDLEKKINELKSMDQTMDMSDEIKQLEKKLKEVKKIVYGQLTAWQSVQISRHPSRPYFFDYVDNICDRFIELHGDRRFSDDKALCGGLATWRGHDVMIIGHQKGREIKDRQFRNFGCAHPEGYRKALRLMKLAEKMKIPIITMIDTPGAYPGVGAEERGQAEAIALNLQEMMLIEVPILVMVIGEGGSGGALGIGVGDRLLMLEHAYYSVISPEGCASILWKEKDMTSKAAEALKLTAKDLKKLGIVDQIIQEPLGGAHKDPSVMIERVANAVANEIDQLKNLNVDHILKTRYQKFRKIGVFSEGVESS